jgi:hypothetical protein
MEQEIRQSFRKAPMYTTSLQIQIHILTLTVIDQIRHLENLFIYLRVKRNKLIKRTENILKGLFLKK